MNTDKNDSDVLLFGVHRRSSVVEKFLLRALRASVVNILAGKTRKCGISMKKELAEVVLLLS